MRRFVLTVIAFILGSTFGLGAGAARWRHAAASPFVQKRILIANRAKDMPPGGVVVFGDSIVERQRLEDLCGRPALNAGMGSAKLADIEPTVASLLEATRPSRVVVEIGPNDFHRAKPTDLRLWIVSYERLLSQLGPHAIVVGMTAHGALDQAANTAMRAAAIAQGDAFVEAVPPAMTEDGVHLNRDGLAEWKRRVDAACSS